MRVNRLLARIIGPSLATIALAQNASYQGLQPFSTTSPMPPRLLKFAGTIEGVSTTGRVTFALYQEQTGGIPLWREGHDVSFNEKGGYEILLGSQHAAGIPADLFTAGEARWLGVQLDGQPEGRRIFLVSVPYALKAGDAETIGGKPLSSFLFVGEKTGLGSDGLHYVSSQSVERPSGLATFAPLAASATVTAVGTPNRVAKFDLSGNLVDSSLFDNGNVGVGTASPARALDVAGTGQIALLGNDAIHGTGSPGLFWYKNSDSYGIFKTNGPWSAPSYQQLEVNWRTGIVIDGGTEYRKSGTVLQPFGGNVGIGTRTPAHTLEVAGDANITGQLLVNGSPVNVPTPVGSTQGLNPKQIALLRWYGASQTGAQFPVRPWPFSLAFDGEAMWVTSESEAPPSVSKLRASDGAILGNYPMSVGASCVAFDGAYIWVTNSNPAESTSGLTVTKLRASDGGVVGVYPAGPHPTSIAFDGSSIWVANYYAGTLTKLKASNGALLGTFTMGFSPTSLAFDGTNIWVSGAVGVVKLRASSGSVLGTYSLGGWVSSVAYDGSCIWATLQNSNAVAKLRAGDGSLVGTYATGARPKALAFDGSSIWIANWDSSTVTKLRSSDGSLLGTYTVASEPCSVAFDGASIWVANHGSHTVSKL